MTTTPTATRPGGPGPASRTATAPLRPLRFVTPAGWPEPDPAWVETMAGWEPPVGWVPAPGLPAAPAGTAFWQPDPDRFPVEEQPFRAQGGNRIGFGLAAVALAGVLVVGLAVGRMQLPAWVLGVVVPALLALGLVAVVTGIVERARARRSALAAVAQTAAERRAGRPAVPYVPGSEPFGMTGEVVSGPGVAAVPARVRRRARSVRRGGARSLLAVLAALVVAVVAWGAPAVQVLPHGTGGPLVALRDAAPVHGAAARSSAAKAPSPAGAVQVGETVTVRSTGQDCLTTCWSWRMHAVRACPSAVAHIEVGTRLGTGRERVARSLDRRLGELPADTVLRFVEDRTPGQQAQVTAVRCDGAPGPLVTASVQQEDQDADWAWRIAPAQSCQAATLTVERDTADDDGTTRVVRVAPLTAGVPVDVVEPRPPGAVTAELLPITC